MERLNTKRTAGMDAAALKKWGILFLTLGIISRTLLQNRLLGLGTVSVQQLLESMQSSRQVMGIATLALVLQSAATCAVPIFALLLVEQFQRGESVRDEFLRLLGIAIITEIPYNLAMGGSLMVISSRNPAFGLVLGLTMLYFYRRYEGKSLPNVLIKILVTAAALAWGALLRVPDSFGLIVMVCVFWAFRGSPLYRNFAGAAAVVLCMIRSPFYLAAPMGFLVIHFYNGEDGTENRVVSDLAYAVILLVLGVAAKLI